MSNAKPELELTLVLLSEAAQLLERLRDNTMDDTDWPRVDALLCDIAAAETKALVGPEKNPA